MHAHKDNFNGTCNVTMSIKIPNNTACGYTVRKKRLFDILTEIKFNHAVPKRIDMNMHVDYVSTLIQTDRLNVEALHEVEKLVGDLLKCDTSDFTKAAMHNVTERNELNNVTLSLASVAA